MDRGRFPWPVVRDGRTATGWGAFMLIGVRADLQTWNSKDTNAKLPPTNATHGSRGHKCREENRVISAEPHTGWQGNGYSVSAGTPHLRRMLGELEAERVHSIVGAFFTVYNYYGYGLGESIYAGALEYELRDRGHQVAREV